jgi:hypothetical protein
LCLIFGVFSVFGGLFLAIFNGLRFGLGLFGENFFAAKWKEGFADEAFGAVASSGGAVFSSVLDHLEMQFFPRLFWPEFFEVGFGLYDAFSIGEFPSLGEAVDVGVDGEGGDFKGVDHDDAGGFVSDSRELFEVFECFGDFSVEFCAEYFREGFDVFGFIVGKSAGLNKRFNLFDRKLSHFFGGGSAFKKGGGYEVDPFVGTLCRKQNGNEQGVGILVV